jgi:hypothetical protein
MATTYDVSLYQGDSWSIAVQWQDTNGDAMDIADAEVVAQIRKHYADLEDDLDPLIEITNGDGVELDTDNDQIVLSLTPEQTASLRNGKYVYDVQVSVNGTVNTLLRGKVSVIAQVTV